VTRDCGIVGWYPNARFVISKRRNSPGLLQAAVLLESPFETMISVLCDVGFTFLQFQGSWANRNAWGNFCRLSGESPRFAPGFESLRCTP